MKQIDLKPIRETHEEYDRIEAKLKELFRTQLYLPLIYEMGGQRKLLQNSLSDLIEAITSGKIYFNRGRFRGKFNSSLSKQLKQMGASWNRKDSSWEIPRGSLSIEIKNAIDVSYYRFQQTAKKVEKKLSEFVPEDIAEKVKLEHIFDATLYKVDGEFKKSIKGITVAPQLTPEGRQKLSKEYTENLKLKIRGWLNEEIQELRKRIEEHSFKGFRYDTLVSEIQKSYMVSQRKAKFLARQETNILVAKFKDTRYQQAGVREYKWRCVTGTPLHPVRLRHKALNDASLKGKLFQFDDPPISTGPGEPVRRCNPGEDYGCRCVAIPVVRFSE